MRHVPSRLAPVNPHQILPSNLDADSRLVWRPFPQEDAFRNQDWLFAQVVSKILLRQG